MGTRSFLSAWNRIFGSRDGAGKRGLNGAKPFRRVLRFEAMEERHLLSVVCNWTGGGVDNKWSTPDNWSSVPGPGDQLVFPNIANTNNNTLDDLTGLTFDSVTFSADGYTIDVIAGNSLTLADAITVEAGLNATVDAPVTLAGPVQINVGTGAALTLSGAVSGPNFLEKMGPGTLNLNAANAYNGGTLLESGILSLGDDHALGDGTGGVIVSGGAQLQIGDHSLSMSTAVLIDGTISGGSLAASHYIVLSGTISTSLGGTNATLVKAASAPATLGGESTYAGFLADTTNSVDIQAGSLVFGYANESPVNVIRTNLRDGFTVSNPPMSSGRMYTTTGCELSYGLGYEDNGQQVIVGINQFGDASRDGHVNSTDMLWLTNHYSTTDAHWTDGDVNYDSVVDSSDLLAIINNFGSTQQALPPRVVGIYALSGGSTTANTVQFIAVFSGEVSGVDEADFEVAWTGQTTSAAHVTSIVGYGSNTDKAVYLLTVSDVYGRGVLGLTLEDLGDPILNANGGLTGPGAAGSDPFTASETYTTASAFIWDGEATPEVYGEGYNGWSIAKNWAGDVAPTAGDSLVFAGTGCDTLDDFGPGVTFGSIDFAANGFSVASSNGGVLSAAAIRVEAGLTATISADVSVGQTMAVDVGKDAMLTVSGSVSGSQSVIKTGLGALKITGDATGLTQDPQVQQGTLLLGALDSVFAASDDLTFSDMLSSTLRVADIGDSGGEIESWSVSPALTDGTLAISSDGIATWTPDSGCVASDHAVAVTFSYSGGKQTKVFSLPIKRTNMPPTFPANVDVNDPLEGWYSKLEFVDAMPLEGYIFDETFTAIDDGPITYELILGSAGLPAGYQFDSSTAEMTFTWGDAPYTEYDFYIKATDAGGLSDLLHVVIPAWLTPSTHDAWLQCDVGGSVGMDLSRVGVGVCPYDVPSGYKEFKIDQAPQHGTLTAGEEWYQVTYTPTDGYRGLDSFKYHLEYDGYDIWGNEVIGRYSTNVSQVQIQMGSYVDLAPADPYATDTALVGSGDSTTLNLTLQNPRADGCPTVGYWEVGFIPGTMRIYGADGKEILSGSKHYAVVSTQTQIPLTIIGGSGGASNVIAKWTVWDGNNDVVINGSTVTVAGWCFYQQDTTTVDVMALTWVNNNNQNITGKHHIPVKDGQRLILGVTGVPNPGAATYQWSVGSYAVKDYVPTNTSGQKIDLTNADYTASSISYAWYAPGKGREARVTVYGVALVASFDISAPEDSVEASANQLTSAGGVDGVNVFFGNMAKFGYAGNGVVADGMTFSANHDNMCPDLFAGFDACFCQVMHSAKYEMFDASWHLLYVDPYSKTNGDRLDGGFPYPEESLNGFHAVDSPHTRVQNSIDFVNGNHLLTTMSFTMWHMCRPTGCDGIWVPLAKLDWNLSFDIEYDWQNNVFSVTRASHTPEQYKVFDSTTAFPEWSKMPNDP